jgi:hypothetical protein
MDTVPTSSPATATEAYDASRDEMVDVMNLLQDDTGVAGTIFVSTRLAAHGPRIKWWPGRPDREGPCLIVTLEDPPRAINAGLPPRVVRVGGADAVAWANLNRAALLEYWENGVLWPRAQHNAFFDRLARLPQR